MSRKTTRGMCTSEDKNKKAGHRTGLYRYRYHSGSFRSGSLRDGTGHCELVHGTERYHDLISVYRSRFIPGSD
ncbi:hypothetical protein KY284_029921 [Solanum tuberosum]|nr:hypothetical protein KY284_029921 [Solanum tuberosum]